MNQPFSGSYKNLAIPEYFDLIEKSYEINIFYYPEKLPVYRLSLDVHELSLAQVFKKLFAGVALDAIKYNDSTVVILDAQNTSRIKADTLVNRWLQGVYHKPGTDQAEERTFQLGHSGLAAQKVTIQGKVIDQSSGEPIIGATLKLADLNMGTTTDEDGIYLMMIDTGRYTLTVDFLGYQSLKIFLSIYQSGILDVALKVKTYTLAEIVIEANQLPQPVQQSILGVQQISVKKIQELSSFLGEADIIKNLEHLAGISTTSEAMSGFNVRGGTVDQNLVLIDQALIYNTSHALGFFSVFNPDAVGHVQLFKGHIPPEFGNRLSSVLQVSLKESNKKQWLGTAGISPASARLGFTGPLRKGTTGLMGAFRSSYTNWILKQISAPNIQQSKVYFGDGIFKLDHLIHDRHKVDVNALVSRDNFQFAKDFGYGWKIFAGNLNWRFNQSANRIANVHLSRSGYQARQYDPQGENAFELGSGMETWRLTTDYGIQLDNHYLKFGAESQWERMKPEIITPYGTESKAASSMIDRQRSHLLAGYVQDEIKLGERFTFHGGFRYSIYHWRGPAIVYVYRSGPLPVLENIIDTLQKQKGETIKSYPGLEPRFSFNISLNNHHTLKMAYNRLRQNIHQLSNTITPTPVDLWQLSTEYMPPAIANSYSIGYFGQSKSSVSWNLQLYYKQLRHQLLSRDFADLLRNDHLETELVQAEGKSYGLELEYNHEQGSWQWNINYTWSRSLNRTVPSAELRINQGKWFPASFDQPHQLTLQVKKIFNPTYSLNATFTFKSGRPITIPISSYGIEEVVVQHFSERNGFRLKPYHRLDIGLAANGNQNKTKGIRHSLIFSLYNLYGQKNPYNIFFRRNSANGLDTYKLSVVGTAFPSLTWNLLF